MSTENTAADAAPVEQTLDDFSAELFGQSEAPVEEATSEEESEVSESDALENDNPTQEEDDTPTEEETEEEVEKPAPKKTRFQERIDELTAGKREAERKAQELEDRLARLEAAKQDPEPQTKSETSSEGPDPYAKNEDGSDVYPLGEYDPNYLRDYTKHLIAAEREAAKISDTQAQEQARIESERLELQKAWESKLDPARERYPDFQEKGEELIASFDGIDEAYGEYLTAQIMDLEYGTDVLYYLATHPDEAKAIVESGARKATVALGRLDARIAVSEETKQEAPRKVSQAPTPPPTNKGAAPVTTVSPDTDDLDAFSRILYDKRRK